MKWHTGEVSLNQVLPTRQLAHSEEALKTKTGIILQASPLHFVLEDPVDPLDLEVEAIVRIKVLDALPKYINHSHLWSLVVFYLYT